jgi:glucosylceramidase
MHYSNQNPEIKPNFVLDIPENARLAADSSTNTVIYNSSFYHLGHFSRFIRLRALCVGCTVSNRSLEAATFLNTEGHLLWLLSTRPLRPLTSRLAALRIPLR